MRNISISSILESPIDIIVDDIEDKVIAPSLIEHKIWEPLETNLVINLLSKDNYVVDVGANIGYYSLLFSRLVGKQGQVYSFEPEPENFCLLEKNIQLNNVENVLLVNKALSDSTGIAELYLSEDNKGDHRLSFTAGRRTCQVDCLSLDSYFSGDKHDIHFVKSDTQGHELQVLRGMKRIIEKNIDHFCCLVEYSPGLLNAADKNGLNNFLDFLYAYPAEIYLLEAGRNGTKLVLTNRKKLTELANKILGYSQPDYSIDILIFFNKIARKMYFKKLGRKHRSSIWKRIIS